MADSTFMLIIIAFFLFAILEETHRNRLSNEKKSANTDEETRNG
jgi:hypothetical protein